jgi:UDP-N-acetylmuramoylalanine--D-glutamate ligase
MGEAFRDRRVSVIGAARSGLDAARILILLGAHVVLSDSQTVERLGEARVAEAKATGALCLFGATPDSALPAGTDLVVTSPGVPRSAPTLQAAVARGIPVWSEIELAYRLAGAPIVAVTGTNGKTTTTLLIAAMLRAAGFAATVCGNVSADEIKRTLVDAAFRSGQAGLEAEAEQSEVLTAEISSFQLEWVERFAPRVGVLTNVSPDHLNRHASFEEYAQTKARLFAAQGDGDRAIVNRDNPTARRIGETLPPARRLWFTRELLPADACPGAWIQDERLTVRVAADGPAVTVLSVNEIPPTLPGAHSAENVLAASAAALLMGAPPEAIRRAVRDFPGVAHRMEFVADVDGVRYINNSMCTNVAAGISSLRAMDRPTILIAGGADKALDFAPLAPAVRERTKSVILIGQAADKLESALRSGGVDAIVRADSLEVAVCMARSLAGQGDAVLLTPVCASFDMFTDFEARGVAFRRAVLALQGGDS